MPTESAENQMQQDFYEANRRKSSKRKCHYIVTGDIHEQIGHNFVVRTNMIQAAQGINIQGHKRII